MLLVGVSAIKSYLTLLQLIVKIRYLTKHKKGVVSFTLTVTQHLFIK
jgi:hypothetical protein